MIATDLRADASALLSALIQINTTNPPGNETAAAEYLAAYLAESGVEATLVGDDPTAPEPGGPDSRPRYRVRRCCCWGTPTSCVADPDEWTVPPVLGRSTATSTSGAAARST